jgi:hypothetical protein
MDAGDPGTDEYAESGESSASTETDEATPSDDRTKAEELTEVVYEEDRRRP